MAESADHVAIAFDPAQIRKAQDRNPFVKISDIVYDILSEAILSSTIAPDSKLNISSIAENLNISHTPGFQAVDRLKNSGLIVESNETSKYHSYRVLDISNESLTNLFTARKAIETIAASICATNVALIDIAQLKKWLQNFGRFGASTLMVGELQQTLQTEKRWTEPFIMRLFLPRKTIIL